MAGNIWPPTLEALKNDIDVPEITGGDTDSDEVLSDMLAAAVAFVERVRPEFNYDADPLSELPLPTADLVLGTVRLAGRWHTRRRSPDGLVTMAEQGSARVPAFDPDIERMLGIGRYRGPVFA